MRLISYDNNGRAAIGVVRNADEFVDLGSTGLAFSTDMTDLLAAPGGLAAVKAAAPDGIGPEDAPTPSADLAARKRLDADRDDQCASNFMPCH